MVINKITYEDIYEYWKLLWDYKFLPKSGVILFNLNERNGSIHENEDIEVSFFGAFINDKIVGVNSGFCPDSNQYRSRGLYVLPEYRRQGIAYELLKATEAQGKKEGKFLLWSVPRQSALSVYLKYGFKQASNFFEADWGIPDFVKMNHCFVIKTI